MAELVREDAGDLVGLSAFCRSRRTDRSCRPATRTHWASRWQHMRIERILDTAREPELLDHRRERGLTSGRCRPCRRRGARTCPSAASPIRFSNDCGTNGASRSAQRGCRTGNAEDRADRSRRPEHDASGFDRSAAAASSAVQRGDHRLRRAASSISSRASGRPTCIPAEAAPPDHRPGGLAERPVATTAPSSTSSRPTAEAQRHAALAVGAAVEIDGGRGFTCLRNVGARLRLSSTAVASSIVIGFVPRELP